MDGVSGAAVSISTLTITILALKAVLKEDMEKHCIYITC